MSTVMVVEDDAPLREALCDTLTMAGFGIAEAENGLKAKELLQKVPVDMVITDIQMESMDGYALIRHVRRIRPHLPVLMITAYGTIEGAVDAMKEGAVDYLCKPFSSQTLVERVRRFLEPPASHPVYGDPITQALFSLARRVAGSEVSVMITGASGTGKEVIARYIHEHSPRAKGPFVAINCAAIPETMLEATLFGYEKGAFTGALQSTPGKFEQAQGGTLLLDEISEMGMHLQAKLLRVLQEREVERLGGRKPVALDVRLLATSNRCLQQEVEAGRFRADLYYRLNVFPLHLPPLKERPGDILPLAKHLLARAAKAQGRRVPRLSREACQRLLQHDWPGNVRELDNLLQRVLILQPGDILEGEDIPLEPVPIAKADQDLRGQEQRLILDTLKAVQGSRKKAAERLGISPRTLRYKLARFRAQGIPIPGE